MWKKRGLVPLLIVGAIAVGIRFLPKSVTESLPGGLATATMPDSELYYLVEGSVYDGDTLRVQRCGEQCEELKIRLCGIDAPEKDQQFGIESRDHLRSLIDQGIEDGRLIVLPVEQDQYGRTVAEIFVPLATGEAEIHLTSQMVMDGYAYHYERYSSGCPNGHLLAGAEEQARSRSAGVWVNPNAVKPWDYRRSQ
ncbi:MAG: thermonuclease family protein [Cyanobacteria bacterium P01_D01_bin.128]